MLPVLKPRTVVIARASRRLKPGQIVLIRHNELDKIKRLVQLRGDELFVVGDNPNASTDSRAFGWLPRESVLGVMVWPRRGLRLDAAEAVDTKGDTN